MAESKRKLKVIPGQDTENVNKNHIKIGISRMVPKEEAYSINEVKSFIALEEQELVNLKAQKLGSEERIKEWKELLDEMESALK